MVWAPRRCGAFVLRTLVEPGGLISSDVAVTIVPTVQWVGGHPISLSAGQPYRPSYQLNTKFVRRAVAEFLLPTRRWLLLEENRTKQISGLITKHEDLGPERTKVRRLVRSLSLAAINQSINQC